MKLNAPTVLILALGAVVLYKTLVHGGQEVLRQLDTAEKVAQTMRGL